jgi:hypothetical protein
MPKNPSANITYGGFDDKGLTVKVKDTSNPKAHWVIWKADYENKDQENEAYTDLLKHKPGDVFGVIFAEKQKSFIGKEGNEISYPERTIYQILPPVATPTQPTLETPLRNDSTASESKSDDFWDKKAYKQCLWNYWLEHGNHDEKGLTQLERDIVWSVFKAIEEDADKRFAKGWAKAEAIFSDGTPVPEELPIIQQEDVDFTDIARDVPF